MEPQLSFSCLGYTNLKVGGSGEEVWGIIMEIGSCGVGGREE
jgi:hypothetical protein